MQASKSAILQVRSRLDPDVMQQLAEPDILGLADCSFYGFKLWRIAYATGAKLAWRVTANLRVPV